MDQTLDVENCSVCMTPSHREKMFSRIFVKAVVLAVAVQATDASLSSYDSGSGNACSTLKSRYEARTLFPESEGYTYETQARKFNLLPSKVS